MKHTFQTTLPLISVVLFAAVAAHASEPVANDAGAPAVDPLAYLDRCNVIWKSPGKNSHDSMPLGNGDVGVNAWMEPSGDLVFYISKTDAWDENDRLCKIGRVRVKFDPPPAVAGDGFRHELELRDGVMEIESTIGNQPWKMLLWVDADQPVVRVEAQSGQPVHCRAEVELWRLRERPFGDQDDSHSGGGLSRHPSKPVVLPDVVITSNAPRVAWYHRNTRSMYPQTLQNQNLQDLEGQFTDPLLNNTFGASLSGDGMVRDGDRSLKSSAPARRHRLAVCVLAERAETPEKWLAHLDGIEAAAVKSDGEESRRRTADWWKSFWNRSWVVVENKNEFAIPQNAHPAKVGVDSAGESRFRGEIAAPVIHGRALARKELAQRTPPVQPVSIPREIAPAASTWPEGLTLEAWIKPAAGENGRIIDKATAGRDDGFLFDAHPGLSLRLIVGSENVVAPNCLKAGQWQHVAATYDCQSGQGTIYLNGEVVAKGAEKRREVSRLTQGYVMQRFMNACAGRGGSPIKFNGSIFTVEKAPGASPETPDGDPDWRAWGCGYWFQNTRPSYWAMLPTGDFEMMEPWFRAYLDALALSKARMKTYYKFDNAAIFPETMYFWGLPCNSDYGWGNKAPEPANGYIKRYWSGCLELIAVMLDRYDFTQDEQFARDTLVPLADPLISFFDQYWKRDANGKIRFDPAQSLETWHAAVNPLPEVAGLQFVLPRLLALPKSLTTDKQRQRWQRMLTELPPIPVREVNGRKIIQPAESFTNCANAENPELYGVYPFRIFCVGRDDLTMARDTYAARRCRSNSCWSQDGIQAALLGLSDEAGHQAAERAAMGPAYRFPAMWGPFNDWIPDQDHGNNTLIALHFMLLQYDGRKLYLLPAWPKDWNVSFKLHAPHNTTVEGVVKAGKLEQLKVTPESRAKDVVRMDQDFRPTKP